MTKRWEHINPFEGCSSYDRYGKDWLRKNTIFVTVHGSQAYGTSTATSDVDLKGVAIPSKEFFLGAFKNFEQAESSTPYDMVIYNITKFMALAAACNPNIVEVLHTSEDDWVVTSPEFELLYEHRNDFLSKKARHTFSGYAISQLKRIKTHRAWLLNPPTQKPTRKEYGLMEQRKLSASEMGAMKKLVDDGVAIDANAMELYHREQRYQTKLREWQQYQKWKRERNVKRAALEAKYGYDCKHAMHLVRLMRMCKEILEEGVVRVRRPDADELLAIRNGEWSYDELIEWANNQEKVIENAYVNSNLPEKTDIEKLNKLCVKLVEMHLK